MTLKTKIKTNFTNQKKCHIDDIKNTNPNRKLDNLTQKTNSCTKFFKTS